MKRINEKDLMKCYNMYIAAENNTISQGICSVLNAEYKITFNNHFMHLPLSASDQEEIKQELARRKGSSLSTFK